MDPDVVGRLRQGAGDAFGRYPVHFAYLFGSHAEGRARADSDVVVDPLRIQTLLDRLGAQIAALRRLAKKERVPSHRTGAQAERHRLVRNLLAHKYTVVDDTRVIEILHTRVDDLQRCRKAVSGAARDDEA